MTTRVVFAPEARQQLLSIQEYISAAANADVALAFTNSIVDYCESFVTFPHRGTLRNDIRPGLRTIGFRRRATIAFTVDSATITILGVFYGGRDVQGALTRDPPD